MILPEIGCDHALFAPVSNRARGHEDSAVKVFLTDDDTLEALIPLIKQITLKKSG